MRTIVCVKMSGANGRLCDEFRRDAEGVLVALQCDRNVSRRDFHGSALAGEIFARDDGSAGAVKWFVNNLTFF